jgi:hypothetical protein
MKPIKLDVFLRATAPQNQTPKIELPQLGLYHAAPREGDMEILSLRYDTATGVLFPAV